jgi:hypothetical protein
MAQGAHGASDKKEGMTQGAHGASDKNKTKKCLVLTK